jgi:hypothetical protein
MWHNWLTQLERQYVQSLLDEATQHVKMRDRKACTAFVQHAIKSRRMSTLILSPGVINILSPKDGRRLLHKMLHRHAGYKNLPCPLRGKALASEVVREGLVTRTKIVKADARSVREECNMAEARRKMKMSDEIGKQCTHVVMLKTKRKQCVEAIKAQAIATGVADITCVWREFHYVAEVSLEAIAAVATLKNVYVLDIHKMACLFHITKFKKVLELLTPSHIFAINMGEDAGILDEDHFHVLVGKIRDGSSALRRWFCESNRTRRAIWVECGLVRDNAHLDKPNVWTVARRKDCELWQEGVRDQARPAWLLAPERDQAKLAWLLAPESAFTGATHYNTNMQDSTCNWLIACAKRVVQL